MDRKKLKIRPIYEECGVSNFYRIYGEEYSNPHEQDIASLIKLWSEEYINDGIKDILDMCAGSGEVSKNLDSIHAVEGLDPYTYNLYMSRNNKKCHKMSFLDIVKNGLPKEYDLVICSYAFHLCSDSLRDQVLYRIFEKSRLFLIIEPGKEIDVSSYFDEIDKKKKGKAKSRLFKRKFYE